MLGGDCYHSGIIDAMAMTLRLTHEEDERLAELAAAEGRSKHKVMRLALAERWAKLHREQQLGEILGRVLPRYRGLLDKIGTA